jgi:putative flippase GtrA
MIGVFVEKVPGVEVAGMGRTGVLEVCMMVLKENLTRLNDALPMWLKQAVKFGIVGVINTGVDLGLYFILTHFTGYFGEQQVLAKGISYTAGILNSFLWNRNWTFKSTTGYFNVTTLLFLLSNLVGLGLNTFVLYVGLKVLLLPELLVLGAATAIPLLWNFLISKFVVFRK